MSHSFSILIDDVSLDCYSEKNNFLFVKRKHFNKVFRSIHNIMVNRKI
jgi:hypothetical protein